MFKALVPSPICLSLTAAAAAADATYRKDIRPLWESKCSACHSAVSPYLGDFLMPAVTKEELAKMRVEY